jgi:Trk K+ transport system NAD-binding subunit
MGTHWDHRVKMSTLALIGFTVFVISAELRHFTHETLTAEILIEPLLVCMIASFWVTNYSAYRVEFLESLHNMAPVVYVVFFTLTGASMELDVVFDVWPIMMVLLLTRIVGIFIGASTAGVMAGEKVQSTRIAWMTFITQAGVGLGLSKEVAVQFPEFGAEFATLMISVIVINTIIGPPFFKAAIRRSGEAHEPVEAQPDKVRDVLIVGIGNQSIELARRLKSTGWKVTLIDPEQVNYERAARMDGIGVHHVPEFTEAAFSPYMTTATDALVAMCPNDEINYQVCELAYEKFGVPRLVVRINNPSWAARFRPFGAHVVDPTSAMVSLLDQSVRSPQSADLLLGLDSEYETVQVTITDRDVFGLSLRELHLPDDVLVLGIFRHNHWVMPHGYTTLRRNDEVTFVGRSESLVEIQRRFGY